MLHVLCACTCTTPNLHQSVLYHTNEVLPNLSYFAVWVVATAQTSSTINIRSTCVAWKEWTKNSNYNPNIFFAKFHLYGWHWDKRHYALYVYELWCHNNQAQPNPTYSLDATCHTTYNLPTYLPPPSWKGLVYVKARVTSAPWWHSHLGTPLCLVGT